MDKLLKTLWQSPTLMTWGSFLAKTLSLVVVLPLILTRLGVEEISLWYLFATIIGFQLLVDVGFSPTFSRVIAYAMGGAGVKDLRRPDGTCSGKPNWSTLEQICSTMQAIYLRLSLLWLFVLASLGTLSLIRPVSIAPDTPAAWYAWFFIIVTSTISFYGNIYNSYLQGINQVALLRRWEIFSSLGAIATSFIVLIFGGKLLSLVVANQTWQILNVYRNRFLSNMVEKGRFKSFSAKTYSKYVLNAVWPSAWRSGLGIIMTYGLIQASGIIYAQIGDVTSVATYLLGLRFIQTISTFSQAPFYSRLPLLARLYAEGKTKKLVLQAQKGMIFSFWSFTIGFIGLGLTGTPLLKYLKSNADFPSFQLWVFLGLAFFLQRYGAMNIQLYSLTNHIIWHISNGISGAIFIILSIVLFNFIDIYAFPIALLIGYMCFHVWYPAILSHKLFSLKFPTFEIKILLFPLLAIISFIIFKI